MKITVKTLFGICFFLFIYSCKNEEVKAPFAEMIVNKTLLTVNETMTINFIGVADQVVIFTGDDMHNYDLREESNTGLVVNKNLFTYAYSVPGEYKIVCIASTYNDLAINLKIDTCSYIVKVIDDITDIENISCPQIVYDEVFAKKMENDEWLMVLPRRIKYGNYTPAISLTQRLRFYIQSDSTKVFINGNAFTDTSRYNLNFPLDILVKSDYGTERNYKLSTINIPEFATFSINGVVGTLVRNEFDYNTLIMQVNLPVGTDVNNIVPEFTTTSPSEKVYIGNTEQISGTSKVNFSNEVIYRLVSTLPDNPAILVESIIVINVGFQ